MAQGNPKLFKKVIRDALEFPVDVSKKAKAAPNTRTMAFPSVMQVSGARRT